VSNDFLMSRGRRLALAFVAAIVVGSIGPWVDVGSDSASGLDIDDGVVTLVLAGIAFAYLLFRPIPHWAPVAALGALAGAVAVFDIVDIEDVGGFLSIASPGWGLYLTAIGGAGLVSSALFSMRTDNEAAAPFDITGKVIVGLAALLVVLAVISTLDDEEVARTTLPEPPELEPEP